MDFIQELLLAYLQPLLGNVGETAGLIISIGLLFGILLISSLINSVVPEFIRLRYPHPSQIIGWIIFFICIRAWLDLNIANAILALEQVAGGPRPEISLLAKMPSLLFWFWILGALPNKRSVRNVVYFMFGVDALLTLSGMSHTWNISTSSSLWDISITICQAAMGAGGAEYFGLYWLIYQWKLATKPNKKEGDKK